MSQKNDDLTLLPSGFVDVLPPHAEAEARSVRVLMDQFLGFGYQLIKPPLIEFEESLLAPGPGARLASETFRLMDPASHRMLGLRSDITAQVARIVSSRLSQAARPLRLTYANDVLRTRGHQMRTERQFTQVGCELIGGDLGVQGEIEICVLAVLGLRALGVRDVTLDLTVPGFLAGKSEDALKAAANRDLASLRGMGEDLIADMAEAAGDAAKALDLLDLAPLRALYDGVLAAFDDLGFDDVRVSLDPLEQRGFEYHRSFGFTLFSAHVNGELGRGGAYDAGFAMEGDAPAKGFTLYMDTVSKVTHMDSAPEVSQVSRDMPWREIMDLQKQGQRIVRV